MMILCLQSSESPRLRGPLPVRHLVSLSWEPLMSGSLSCGCDDFDLTWGSVLAGLQPTFDSGFWRLASDITFVASGQYWSAFS